MSEKKKKSPYSNTIHIENRKARFEYEILEKIEAGIELTGCEVKSLRLGHGQLTDVYATNQGDQLFLRGMHIKPYLQGGLWNGTPDRDRRLLLKRAQLDRLIGATSVQGLTVVPLRVYFNERGWAKVEIALCRGKKAHDKRDAIRERDLDREMRREFKVR